MSRFDHRRYRPGPVVNLPNRQWPNRTIREAPIWASVDLRDGNQALHEPMDVEQKRRLWDLRLSRRQPARLRFRALVDRGAKNCS